METPDGFSIIATLDQGLAGSHIDPLVNQLGVTLKEFADLLGVAERTLHRFRKATLLDRAIAERIVLMEALVKHGLDVFDGDQPVFARWLRHALGELNQRPPLHWLTTATGIRLVDEVLTRIDYGIYV